MAIYEVREIDLDVTYGDVAGATVKFRVMPQDAKADIEGFDLEISVPRQDTLDETVSRAVRAMHRLAQALVDQTRPPSE